MQIPDMYLAKINPLVDTARGFVERGESLAAIAFIGKVAGDGFVPVLMDDTDESTKDARAQAVAKTALISGADYIFQVREAWELPEEHVHRFDAIMEKYGSIGKSPDAKDVATFSLETNHGTWVASAVLKRKSPSKTKRTFGPLVFRHVPELQGRFANLLPAKANEGGALH